MSVLRLTRCALPVVAMLLGAETWGATRTVALSGDVAPGLEESQPRFVSFSLPPVLNDRGEVAFIAGTSENGSSGVWSEGGGTGLALVAHTTIPAPGVPFASSFASFDRLVLNNPGQVAIEATFSRFGSNATGLWLTAGGALNLVAHEGQILPGGVHLRDFLGKSSGVPSPPVLNDRGQVAFSSVGSSNNDQGLFASDESARLTPIAIARNTVTGLAGGIDFIGAGRPVMNNRGQLAFNGYLAPNGFINGPYFADPRDGLSVVARTDTVLPDGRVFNTLFTQPIINDAGDVAFWGTSANQIAGSQLMGIWTKRRGQELAADVLTNSQAPGTPAGNSFSGFYRPALNSQGDVAFTAVIAGTGVNSTNQRGIWAEGRKSLRIVTRTGELAPGLSTPFTFLSEQVTFNRNGQVAFLARTANANGIWATDAGGSLRLIVATGLTIDLNSGPTVDLRTVSAVTMVGGDFYNGGIGNEDGQASAFNELGQVAFAAQFTDGSSGVFVSDLVMIPVPPTLMLCVLGCAALGLTRGFTK
jgi:hypothetical protein